MNNKDYLNIDLKGSINPYTFLRDSISTVSIKFLVLLFIQLLMLFFTKSYNSLQVAGTAILGALCAASLNYLFFKQPMYNSFSTIITGIMIGLLLPSSYPVIAVFYISFSTLFIARIYIHKGITILNPVAIAIAMAWVIGRSYFPKFGLTVDLISVRNPSVSLISSGYFTVYSFDSNITLFLNNYIFSLLKISIPEGLISILWDTNSIIPAFRFNLLTIISSVVIFSDDYVKGIIPGLFVLVYGILVRVFVPYISGGMLNQGDIILAIFTSGTLFCSVFLLQYFGTIPSTISGKIIFGIISGIVAFLIMGCGTSPIGMVYTVLLCNLINIVLCFWEDNRVMSKYLKRFSISNKKNVQAVEA